MKQKMKKMIVLGLSCVMAASVMAGCGESQASPESSSGTGTEQEADRKSVV